MLYTIDTRSVTLLCTFFIMLTLIDEKLILKIGCSVYVLKSSPKEQLIFISGTKTISLYISTIISRTTIQYTQLIYQEFFFFTLSSSWRTNVPDCHDCSLGKHINCPWSVKTSQLLPPSLMKTSLQEPMVFTRWLEIPPSVYLDFLRS